MKMGSKLLEFKGERTRLPPLPPNHFEVFSEVAEALDGLSNRLGVVALTNTDAVHCQAWQARYRDVLGLFRRAYISSDMGLRKPEATIYQAVLEESGTPAGAALFWPVWSSVT